MAGGGSILNISSGAGLRPLPELSVYAASKAAVIALTRSLAGELADRNIRVNCLCPGLVDTPLAQSAQKLRSANAAQETQGFENYLVKRFGTPDELSAAALMLLTNDYITGSTLAVDGGRTLH
jgi:NAD(P)-dependent dehydrogenase (short-subunit alcohol dehydrogenase family)